MFSARVNAITKEKLFSILDEVTSPAVLKLHQEFSIVTDKHAFLTKFESVNGIEPVRDTLLKEEWLHYCWIRLELSFLGYQNTQIMKRLDYNEALETNFDNPEPSTLAEIKYFNPAVPETVAAVIQADAINNVSIQDSLRKLQEVCLQVVGTEHPTDPLSQESRDILSFIAAEVMAVEPDVKKIKRFITKLQYHDAIPDVRREVDEEVSRDKEVTGKQFYYNLPVFIKSIFDAYSKFYEAEFTPAVKESIWQILEGGLQADGRVTTPIIQDASWPGGDADGNNNATDYALSVAIRDRRTAAAEQHDNAIAEMVEMAKGYERKMRDAIPDLHDKKFDCMLRLTNDTEIIRSFQRFQSNVTRKLVPRDFTGLVDFLEQSKSEIASVLTQSIPNPTEEQIPIIQQIFAIVQEQATLVQKLDKLTAFSGSYKGLSKLIRPISPSGSDDTLLQSPSSVSRSINFESKISSDGFYSSEDEKLEESGSSEEKAARQGMNGAKLANGALGDFQKIFQDIIQKVGNDKNSNFIKQNNLSAILARFKNILQDHQEILREYPDLYEKMRYFGVQLHCYGMGYGNLHVRQDSTVFMHVWDLLFNDLQNVAAIDKKLLPEGRFKNLSAQEQAVLFQKLLDESEDSLFLLNTIYQRWKTQHYSNLPGYATVCMELHRIGLALNNADIFENLIISNTESLAHILSVMVLKRLFPLSSDQLTVVPLLEKREDLENFHAIVEGFIRLRILQKFRDNPFLKSQEAELAQLSNEDFKHRIRSYHHMTKAILIEVMFGYSDSERVSGLSALIKIDIAQEAFLDLAKEYGVTSKIFDAPGGDLFRGGLHLMRRKQKVTAQGNARQNEFGTRLSASIFRETQFANSYLNLTVGNFTYKSFPKPFMQRLVEFCDTSANFYEKFLNTDTGYGSLVALTYGWGANFIMDTTNSSSRGNSRNTKQNHSDRTMAILTGQSKGFVDPDKLRAITSSALNEMLRLNMHIIIGPGHAMRKLDADLDTCAYMVKSFYFLCPAFQDLYEKTIYGFASVNLDIAAYAYFGNDASLRATDADERAVWAKEAESYAGIYTREKVEYLLTTAAGKAELLIALSRFFALIEQEFYLTRDFLIKTNALIYTNYYKPSHDADRAAHPEKTFTQNIDLIQHHPELYEQMKDVLQTVDPLNWVLARLSNHLANQHKLDEVYAPSTDFKLKGSRLNLLGRMLGNIACGITSSRILLVATEAMRPRQLESLTAFNSSRRAEGATPSNSVVAQSFNQLLKGQIPQLVAKSREAFFADNKMAEQKEVAREHSSEVTKTFR
jgi:phosphoenolpyruvate carboxylase